MRLWRKFIGYSLHPPAFLRKSPKGTKVKKGALRGAGQIAKSPILIYSHLNISLEVHTDKDIDKFIIWGKIQRHN